MNEMYVEKGRVKKLNPNFTNFSQTQYRSQLRTWLEFMNLCLSSFCYCCVWSVKRLPSISQKMNSKVLIYVQNYTIIRPYYTIQVLPVYHWIL